MASLRMTAMLVAALFFAAVLTHVRPSAQNKPAQNRTASCPLTDEQTERSIAAFSRIASVLTGEPRCVNCHGGVNPHIPGTGLDKNDPAAPASKFAHGGGEVTRHNEIVNGVRLVQDCRECHNNMARKTNGDESLWMTAPNDLSFVDKDATTLCRQIKRSTGSAEHFLGHLKDDNGGNAFGKTAFNGDRGLDPDIYGPDENGRAFVEADPPSARGLTHDELMRRGQDWVAAMGGSFKGDEGCGCEYRHAGWSGQIRYTRESKGDEGHNEQQDWNNYEFVQIILTFKDGVGTATTHGEHKQYRENRRWIVRNNTASLIFDNSQDSRGSVGGTTKATLDVRVAPNGMYSAVLSYVPPVGTSQATNCWGESDTNRQAGRVGCTTKKSTWGVGDNGRMSIAEKPTDPNRLHGSRTERREEVGHSLKGVTIETTTWDLWRSN